jgi:thiol:disulfide interchange protein
VRIQAMIGLWLAALICAFATVPAQAETVKTAHIEVELVAASDAVAPGGEVWIALRHKPMKGWHTYWQNPGEAGLATTISWIVPDGVIVGPLNWPTPEVLPYQQYFNYGYGHDTYILARLKNTSALKDGVLPLRAKASFLVCADICIPESAEVRLDLKVSQGAGPGNRLDKALSRLPKDLAGVATYKRVGKALRLGFVAPLAGSEAQTEARNNFTQPSGVYFFPESEGLFAATAAQAVDLGSDGFSIDLTPTDRFAEWAVRPQPLHGVLKFATGDAYQVTLTAGELPAGTSGLGAPAQAREKTNILGVALSMILAFIGGIILNLMPCVFPVLSMKILALARAGHDQKLAQTEALLYAAGAVISFVVLSLILNLATATGSAIGWGFQLQSPHVTAALALLMVLVGLNMLGLFEVGMNVQTFSGQVLGSLKLDSVGPWVSAFMTGVLAVLVAAPCTAPFMATAIGVALSQGGLVSFLIFLSLGLGFAAPIVALTYLITIMPGMAAFMPRPGAWMEWLKRILAIPMFGAAIWLIWVFAQQVSGGLWLLLIGFVLVIVSILTPQILKVLPKLELPAYVRPLMGFLGAALIVLGADLPRVDKPEARTVVADADAAPVIPFKLETLAALRKEGRPVFVDMTAAWCVSCKVNEKLIFVSPAFQKALKDSNTAYVVGDWTNQDAEITRYLSLYGRSGVPLYVYYPTGDAKPQVLGQVLDKAKTVALIKTGK